MRLLVVLCVCSLGCIVLTGCGDSATAQETPKKPAYAGGGGGEPTITLEKDIHFTGAEGKDVVVPSGIYRVKVAGEDALRLIPLKRTGKAIVVKGVKFAHKLDVLTNTVTCAANPANDSFTVCVTLPDGAGTVASGSYSGTPTRAASVTLSYEGVGTEWQACYYVYLGSDSINSIILKTSKTWGTYPEDYLNAIIKFVDEREKITEYGKYSDGYLYFYVHLSRATRILSLLRDCKYPRVHFSHFSDGKTNAWFKFIFQN